MVAIKGGRERGNSVVRKGREGAGLKLIAVLGVR